MSRCTVVPIVEGHGEWACVRILLQRIWTELLGGEHLEVLQPIRGSRGKLLQEEELGRWVKLGALKLKASEAPGFLLLLLDADKDRPCELAPTLLRQARKARSDLDVACVLAHPEYETWFVAAAESLGEYLDLRDVESVPDDPEAGGLKKAWIESRFRARGARYSETVDQPRMTAAMDLRLCRDRSPSFDKLCRELERRLE